MLLHYLVKHQYRKTSENLKHASLSQGSVATYLRCGGLFSNHFTTVEFASETISKICEHLAKLQARRLHGSVVQRRSSLFSSFITITARHHCRASSTAPPRSYLRGGWKQRTRLTSVTLRSSMVCMPEPADWPWTPAWQTRGHAVQLLTILPEGEFTLKLKFLRNQNKGDWVAEDKFDPVRAERKKRQIVVVSRRTTLGLDYWLELTASTTSTSTQSPQSCMGSIPPVTRDPNTANVAALRDGHLNCVTRRVVEHFKVPWEVTDSHRTAPKIQEWDESPWNRLHGRWRCRPGKDSQEGDHPAGHRRSGHIHCVPEKTAPYV